MHIKKETEPCGINFMHFLKTSQHSGAQWVVSNGRDPQNKQVHLSTRNELEGIEEINSHIFKGNQGLKVMVDKKAKKVFVYS